MILIAPPIEGCLVNDLDAINAIVTHPGVYGEAARVPSIENVLILTVRGVAVVFGEVRDRVHEVHVAAVPESRGAVVLQELRTIRDWWWDTQPSDMLLGPVRHENAASRYLIAKLGFHRMNVLPMPGNDGIIRDYVTYRMDRPQ